MPRILDKFFIINCLRRLSEFFPDKVGAVTKHMRIGTTSANDAKSMVLGAEIIYTLLQLVEQSLVLVLHVAIF